MGRGTPRRRPAAVVRMNVSSEEVPQLFPVVTEAGGDDEKENIAFTSTKLHRAGVDFGAPFWVLFNVPRNYQAKRGSLGSKLTRWDADPGRGGEEGERETNELKTPWWTMTAAEIYPVSVLAGADTRTTARLCHQTIAWSARSRYAVPLHAAKQLNLNHPQYQRSAPPEEDDRGNEGGAE